MRKTRCRFSQPHAPGANWATEESVVYIDYGASSLFIAMVTARETGGCYV